MQLSPDTNVIASWGPWTLSATIVFTWLTIAVLVGFSLWLGRGLSAEGIPSHVQSIVETIVEEICQQIEDVTQQDPTLYLPFVGSLFLFIVTANILTIIPGFEPPTGSLSTTVALSICVFFAVPIYGIGHLGLRRYLLSYLKPTPLMLPFQIIGEFSRTVALAMRLFGNIMSGSLITAILLSIVPFFIPALMQAMGLVFGVIQAYVFAVLSLVYISSAASISDESRGYSPVKKTGAPP